MKRITKISLCIPVYNRPELTVTALKSAVDQTVKPFEIIIRDDGSTDDMSTVVYFCRENKLKYIRSKKNIGLIASTNELIKLSKGDFVCVLHNDDYLSPRYIEQCTKSINKYPKFDVYVSNGGGIDQNGKVIAEFRLFEKDTIINKIDGIRKLYKRGFHTTLSIIGSTFYRASFIKKHLFDESLGNEADLDMSLFCLTHLDMIYIDKAIYFARLHNLQESARIKKEKTNLNAYIRNRISLYKKYQKYTNVDLLSPVIAEHFLQVFFKYKYPLAETLALLEIDSLSKKTSLIESIVIYFMYTLKHKMNFFSHVIYLNKYLLNH